MQVFDPRLLERLSICDQYSILSLNANWMRDQWKKYPSYKVKWRFEQNRFTLEWIMQGLGYGND
jgi:hypothetical protein